MKYFILFVGILSMALVGCVPRNPVTNTSTVDSRPTLSFVNAKQGNIVMVDGVDMGDASIYNGNPKVLTIIPGTHEVVILENNAPIFQQTIFVESEHKTIIIK